MNRIAIILARGGSKRIPRKNIKPFLGKAIIGYPIAAALSSELFSEVMVSTDDEEIKAVAEEFGATVPFLRSVKNSDDHATSFDAVEEVLSEYKKRGKSFDQACCIYPTAVFMTAEILHKAVNMLEERQFDAVFPVIAYGHPIQRSFTQDKTGKVRYKYPENALIRTQDLEPIYHDSGQFYLFAIAPILEQKKIITDNTGAIRVSEMEAHDIDELSDWDIAEYKYKSKLGG